MSGRLLPDARFRSPTILPPSLRPFAKQVVLSEEAQQSEILRPDYNMVIRSIAAVGQCEGMTPELILDAPARNKFRVNLWYLTQLWPRALEIEPGILLASTDSYFFTLVNKPAVPGAVVVMLFGQEERESR